MGFAPSPHRQKMEQSMEKSSAQITGGWGSPTTEPLERFMARVTRVLADPTIKKATVPVDELRAALESLSHK